MIDSETLAKLKCLCVRSKEILEKYKGEELQKACAEWTMDILDEFEFYDIPPKTLEIADYEKYPLADRLNLTEEYYHHHPQIMAYYSLVKRNRVYNRSNFDWLTHCKKYVSEEDKIKINRILDNVSLDMLSEQGRDYGRYRQIG